MKLKIVSFNVQHFLNYVTRKIDMDMFERVIRDMDADLIGLNEVYGSGPKGAQVQDMGARLGYHAYFAKAIDAEGEGAYGNGLLSLYPLKSARVITVPDPVSQDGEGYYETRCILQADIDVPGGLQVNVVHMGLNPDEQQSAVCTAVEHVAAKRAVLMGDFNMTPDDVLLMPLFSFLKDTAALFDGEKLSFPSDDPEMKIDYILLTPDLTPVSADIPALVASDHRPHMAVAEV